MLSLDLTDNLARFPVPYGYQPIKGWSAKHFETTVSQSTQRTKQNALGEGPWDGVEGLWADAFSIPDTDYAFHRGTGSDSPDAFFPDEPPHLWTAWISAKCPAGISADQAEKLFGVYRCMRTPDFNADGVQIDIDGNPIGGLDPREYYFFKPNPANCAVDQILRWGQRPSDIINFPAWVDWRDYNDQTIKWDDSKYTPRNLSITPTGGGALVPGTTYYVRVSSVKGGDESSASQKTIETEADSITLAGGQTAFQVNWLIKGDEDDPADPPVDISSFRVYIGTVPGVWVGYFTVAGPALRSLLITSTAGTTGGVPLNEATAGLLRDIKRFECGLFFVPPYSLASALNRICQISCADWQWSGLGTGTYRNDKIRFMSPVGRDPIFTLDAAQIAPGTFKTWSIDRRSRYNQIIGNFRDRDDLYLNVGTPVIIDREELQGSDKQVKTLTIDFGSCFRSQVQRVCSYWARMLCDLDQAASLTGSPKTYHVLPADVVEVTDDTTDWVNLQFMVAKKSEIVENSLGDPITLMLYSPDAYSDTNHSPLPRPLPRAKVDPFAKPPIIVSLTLSEVDTAGITSQPEIWIHGVIQAAEFSQPQILRVWVKPPGAISFESTGTMLVPLPGTLQASFDLPARSPEALPWNYEIRVTTESQLGNTLEPQSVHVTESITITGPPAPPPPSNWLGWYANSGVDDLLMDWVPGQIYAADTWLAFELQFRNSSNTANVGNPIIIRPSLNRVLTESLVWDPTPATPVLSGDVYLHPNGGAVLTGNFAIISKATAPIGGGLVLYTQIPSSNWNPDPPNMGRWFMAEVGILPDGQFPYSPPRFYWAVGGGLATPEGNIEYPQFPIVPGDILTVRARPDGIVEYRIGADLTSPPLFKSGYQVDFNQSYRAFIIGSGAVQQTLWQRDIPEFVLTGLMQDNLYGSRPLTIHAKLRQLNPYPNGQPSSWVDGSFAR